MTAWNPRFVLYANHRGLSPEEVLEKDEKRWPGGKMVGYMLWIDGMWRAWRTLKGYNIDTILGQADHDEFDAWLAGLKYKEVN